MFSNDSNRKYSRMNDYVCMYAYFSDIHSDKKIKSQ